MFTMICFLLAGLNGYFLMQAGWHITPDLYWNAVGGAVAALVGIVHLIKGQ